MQRIRIGRTGMASQDGHGVLQALRLIGSPRTRMASGLQENIVRHVVALQHWAKQADWAHVERVGAQCLGLGYGLFRQVHGEDALNVLLPRALPTERSIINRRSASMASSREMALLALHRGLLAWVHAAFNGTLLAADSRRPRRTSSLRDSFEAIVDEHQAALESAQSRLQAALSNGPAIQTATDSALALAGLIEERLPPFARAQGKAFSAIATHLREGRGTAAKDFGRLSVRAGALTRQALAAHVAAYRLCLTIRRVEPDEETATVRDSARNLPLRVKFPGARLTPLAHVSTLSDGDDVKVRAFVTSVSANRTADGKLVSHIELVDPSSEAVGRALTIFTHLPHLGLTEGACCELSGRFDKSSNLAAGQAAIVVDRLSLADLATRSWQIAFLRTAERWYRAWPNGEHIFWALGPQRIAPNLDTRSAEGAGELIYARFIRSAKGVT